MPLGTYSQGMRARFSFALLLALEFDIYLIDEGMPSSTDVEFNRKAGGILRERLDDATVVVVSHSPKTLEKFVERRRCCATASCISSIPWKRRSSFMTTKPKAKKFRIRRSALADRSDPRAERPDAPRHAAPAHDRGAVGGRAAAAAAARAPELRPRYRLRQRGRRLRRRAVPPPRATPTSPSPGQVSAEIEIDAIRREGLTGRQLRMARRVAQKHGLAPTSDFDAVRLLRAQRHRPVRALDDAGTGGRRRPAGRPVRQQGTAPTDAGRSCRRRSKRAASCPRPQVMTEDARAREILRIQQDIARRRRRKLALLLARLAFFVLLPTVDRRLLLLQHRHARSTRPSPNS